MPACSQCGKPGIFRVGDHALCVDCNLKVVQANQIRDRMLRQRHNDLIAETEAVTGLYGVMPRYDLSEPVAHHGPITFHNIKVDRSVVGVINTGDVGQIDSALTNIGMGGNAELQTVLSDFTQAVLNEKDVDTLLRNEILEQLAVLTSQVTLPTHQRKQGVLKAMFKAVSDSVSTIAALSALWEKVHPLLIAAFAR